MFVYTILSVLYQLHNCEINLALEKVKYFSL